MVTLDRPRKIRIAIIGGGIAGAAIANALFKLPHLDVDLYESRPEISGNGGLIALATNAQRALGALVPSLQEFFERACAVPMRGPRYMIGSGPKAGTKVMDLAIEHPGYTVRRAALVRELLALLPRETVHTSKRLVAISIANVGTRKQCFQLRFKDGSTASADALIGADDIFGFVRPWLLGPEHSASRPLPAGWTDTINMVPLSKVQEKLGAEPLKEYRQYNWIGQGGFMTFDVLSDRELVQCVCSPVVAHPSSTQRRMDVIRRDLEEAYAAWLDGPIAGSMIDLLVDQDDPAAYAQWVHQDAPTYIKGRVALAGDAAHAMTPWQSSGAGSAIEDAVILGVLLAKIKTPEEIEAAFKAYDRARPRAQAIAESSRMTGRILTGLVDDVGLDPDRLREALSSRQDFIHNLDLEDHQAEALAALQAIII